MKDFYFCIDVGGTDIKGGIVDKNYNIIKTETIKTTKSADGNELVKSVLSLINILERKTNLKVSDALGVGIAFPGLVDGKKGMLKFIPSLNLVDFNIVMALKKHLSVPIKIANDAELALIAEHKLGAGKDCKNFAMLTLGTGIGSGLVVNNKPLRSLLPYSCELGHNMVSTNEFENLASTRALIEKTIRAMKENKNSAMWKTYSLETVSGKTVFDYKDSDETAKKVFDEFIMTLGMQIVNLYNIFTPELIVLGGGISAQGEKLTLPLENFINQNIFLKIIGQRVKVTTAKFLNNAGILGARCLFN